jgi:hypothetical protein
MVINVMSTRWWSSATRPRQWHQHQQPCAMHFSMGDGVGTIRAYHAGHEHHLLCRRFHTFCELKNLHAKL